MGCITHSWKEFVFIISKIIGKLILLGIIISLLVLSISIGDLLEECLSNDLILDNNYIISSKDCEDYISKYFPIKEEEYSYNYKVREIESFFSSIQLFQNKILICKILIIISLVLILPSSIYSCLSMYCTMGDSDDIEYE